MAAQEVWFGWEGFAKKYEVSHRHRVQFVVPIPGFEVERNLFFGRVLAHSNFCQTVADETLNAKCGSVGRNWEQCRNRLLQTCKGLGAYFYERSRVSLFLLACLSVLYIDNLLF